MFLWPVAVLSNAHGCATAALKALSDVTLDSKQHYVATFIDLTKEFETGSYWN